MRISLAIIAILGAVGLGASCVPDSPVGRETEFSLIPPARYQSGATVEFVHFVDDPSAPCQASEDELHYKSISCTVLNGNKVRIVALNPCKASGKYARQLCHTIAHSRGWPMDHPA
jgi:hypothetical protein